MSARVFLYSAYRGPFSAKRNTSSKCNHPFQQRPMRIIPSHMPALPAVPFAHASRLFDLSLICIFIFPSSHSPTHPVEKPSLSVSTTHNAQHCKEPYGSRTHPKNPHTPDQTRVLRRRQLTVYGSQIALWRRCARAACGLDADGLLGWHDLVW